MYFSFIIWPFEICLDFTILIIMIFGVSPLEIECKFFDYFYSNYSFNYNSIGQFY